MLNVVLEWTFWQSSQSSFNLSLEFFDSGQKVSFHEWLNDWIIAAPDDDQLQISFYLILAIWLTRNKVVWENQLKDPYQVQKWAMEELRYFCSITTRCTGSSKDKDQALSLYNIRSPQQLPDTAAIIRIDGAYIEKRRLGAAEWEVSSASRELIVSNATRMQAFSAPQHQGSQ
ncbi:OLC1v1014014C1 [Oldenlandia corymbosa var. corymbosa]|uniref:OLC1v1014014C1 n=1 Tax=Oldenlandia corymbosa var. corymbosa TaxID=529605 RepID=A0AAV1E1S8_OLDCO|nr:OLC1v1014014C1 [Oldenlandia corymbosa var. corymbosa]